MPTSRTDSVYVDGEWRPASGSAEIAVLNPSTEERIESMTSASAGDVDDALDAARAAQRDWARRPAKDRGDALKAVADTMRAHGDELADLITREQGKPISSARGEVEGAADLTEYNAEWDRRIEGDIVPSDARNEAVHLVRKPHGVVAAITPWNYPVTLFVRKMSPALVTGNTVVLKPSPDTPLSSLRLMELIDEEVDLPPGVLNVVTGDKDVGEQLVTDARTDMVAMTGSTRAGKAIMRDAAENLTPVSLELGGKAPAIVWKDADVDEAVEDILTARMTNTGQVCTCAERVYVHSDILGEFEDRYVAAAEKLTVGDPMEDPDMGPQVNERELESTRRAVADAREGGATVMTGGDRPAGEDFERGYWFEPTVISGVGNDMDLMQNEIFGPVTPIMEVSSLDDVIDLANDSRYGLSSYVFTDDYRTAMRIAEDLDFGETYINRTLGESWQGHHTGWNESGIGGDDGKHGVLGYTQLKTVYHNYD
jgi:lactaldehyde dehydrogenase/glycolaldehyde dehydrogenase